MGILLVCLRSFGPVCQWLFGVCVCVCVCGISWWIHDHRCLSHNTKSLSHPYNSFKIYLSIFKAWTWWTVKIYILFYIKNNQSNTLKYKKYIKKLIKMINLGAILKFADWRIEACVIFTDASMKFLISSRNLISRPVVSHHPPSISPHNPPLPIFYNDSHYLFAKLDTHRHTQGLAKGPRVRSFSLLPLPLPPSSSTCWGAEAALKIRWSYETFAKHEKTPPLASPEAGSQDVLGRHFTYIKGRVRCGPKRLKNRLLITFYIYMSKTKTNKGVPPVQWTTKMWTVKLSETAWTVNV